MAAAGPTLLADIGGTNARLALLHDDHGVTDVARLAVADFAEPLSAFRTYLDRHSGATPPVAAIIAVAGPVEGNRARLTNGAWSLEAGELASDLGLSRVRLVNDYEALARALPYLGLDDLAPVGGGHPAADASMLVLGPGTGLGVGAFLPNPEGGGRAVVGEGGHATLAAGDHREAALIARLRAEFGHVSAERVLSGPGLVNLARAIAAEDGLGAPPQTPEAVTEAAVSGACPACVAALEAFWRMLGGFAGDLALVFGARGGVYLAGGIAPRFADVLRASDFRARFEDKGRFRQYLEAVPSYVVVHPDPAFLGLAALAEEA